MTLKAISGQVRNIVPAPGAGDTSAILFDVVDDLGPRACAAMGDVARRVRATDADTKVTVIGTLGRKTWTGPALLARSIHAHRDRLEAMPTDAKSVMAKRRVKARRAPHEAPRNPEGTPDMGPILGALGEAAAWRYKMLRTAFDRMGSETNPRGWFTVNRRGFPPLAPHGQSLVDDGFMTLHRSGTSSSKTTTLSITDAGIAELERLEKKVAKLRKRHAFH